jgi:peptidoglycan/LPS O-acetylase OafA/YrhL
MKPRTLSQSGSAFLDCVRFGTAIVVFLGHLGRFFPAVARFARLTHIAVCVFFVLSGFVIRMIASTRIGSMRDFLIDRASRIYSVTVPALCLTVVFEGIGRLVNPVRYFALADPFRWSHIPLQFLTNLTFTAQSWGYETNPLSNSPFWSLSFECVYYLLFGLLFYGMKRLSTRFLVLLVMLLAGPATVLLFPTWLMGCLLYDTYIWLDQKRYGIPLATGLLFSTLGLMGIFRHPIGWLLNQTDAPHRIVWLQTVIPLTMRNRLADSNGVLPWLSRFSLSYYIASVVVFVVMLWVLLTLDRYMPKLPEMIWTKLRWIAEGTFSLYLLHLPLLMMISCLLGGQPKYPYLWSFFAVSVCILLSRPFERLKVAMRRGLRIAFPGREARA